LFFGKAVNMSRLTRLKASIEKLESVLAQNWPQSAGSTSASKSLDSWDDYLQSKNLAEWRDEDPELRASLITELLTYPLTLASYLRTQTKPKSLIHIVGARAEATLPVIYWAQALRELDQENLTLHFIGPDIPAKLSKTDDVTNVGKQTLKRSFLSMQYSMDALGGENPDLFVMFNPGLAHEKFKKGWRPVVKSMLDGQKPMLITGLHMVDASNDYEMVKRIGPALVDIVPPKVNPFSSSKEFADGLSGRIAKANLYVWNVQN
jgi:hypothetical protein